MLLAFEAHLSFLRNNQRCRSGHKSGRGALPLAPAEGGCHSRGFGSMSPRKKIETRVSEIPFPELYKEIYRAINVTECYKISQVVLSALITEIISINFVVYY